MQVRGAAEVLGRDVQLNCETARRGQWHRNAFEKQRPDGRKMNQTETFCVRICLCDSGTRQSRPQRLVRESPWFDCTEPGASRSLWGRVSASCIL